MSNRPLESIFNKVPPTYDSMNRLLTLGLDRVWRAKAAKCIARFRPRAVLDLCTGTGDFAFELAKRTRGETLITAIDYSQPMLEYAERKRNSPNTHRIDFVYGDASKLPFDTGVFDAVGISFALRNLTFHNPVANAALAEVRRVLKPGGVFVGVESSQPSSRVIRRIRDRYVDVMVGRLAVRLSGHAAAYRYLAYSMKNYFTPAKLESVLRSAGFESFYFSPLLLGAAGIFVAS